MVFSSLIFLFQFLPLALLLYYLAPRRGKHLLLVLLSYAFYGWANPLFVLLMLWSTLVDYVCGLAIAERLGKRWKEPIERLPTREEGGTRTRRQKIALAVSIISNLSLLGFFKYFNFGIDNYNQIVTALGWESAGWDTFFRITLPLGISFYTFQSMSYSIDIYRGEARGIRNFIDFACYVSLFPQLVAGPIIRFQEVDDQLRQRDHTLHKFSRGVALFMCGLAKKVMLANTSGKIADMAFESGGGGSFLDAWFGIVAYAFQIYFDFSAYSDMAIGLGLMLGFTFPKNFNSPYLAKSITEFWQRWHLSLSTWLRDYLYIPLGGNRKGGGRTYVNLAMVMLLGGLWHGASWNFVIWGAIHGGMLGFERAQGKSSPWRRMPGPLQMLITFVIVCIAWVFFRATDLDAALGYLAMMFGLAEPRQGAALIQGVIYQPYYLLWMGVAAGITWVAPQSWDFTQHLTWPKAAWLVGLTALSVVLLTTQSFNPFIYFIF